MTFITHDEIAELINHTAGPCVSLYVPMATAGREVEGNRIRFKNRLQAAREALTERGLNPREIGALLGEANNLVDEQLIWQHQRQGLAVFIAPDWLRSYQLSRSVPELTVVGERFHVKPLLVHAVQPDNGRFYILALSQNEARLLEATPYAIETVDAADMPPSLAEALRFEEIERQLQFHTSTSPSAPLGTARRRAIFHGQGAPENDEKNQILRYFQQIDRGLQAFWQTDDVPLVLAAVGYLYPIYAEANNYPHLLKEFIRGNPEAVSADELHDAALEIVEPLWAQAVEDAKTRYQHAKGQSQAVTGVESVLETAHQGRLDTLFVAVDAQQRGVFDAETGAVELDASATADLLDVALVHTWRNAGDVFVLPQDEMPDGAVIAGILRF